MSFSSLIFHAVHYYWVNLNVMIFKCLRLNIFEALYSDFKKWRHTKQMTNLLNYQWQASIHFNWLAAKDYAMLLLESCSVCGCSFVKIGCGLLSGLCSHTAYVVMQNFTEFYLILIGWFINLSVQKFHLL